MRRSAGQHHREQERRAERSAAARWSRADCASARRPRPRAASRSAEVEQVADFIARGARRGRRRGASSSGCGRRCSSCAGASRCTARKPQARPREPHALSLLRPRRDQGERLAPRRRGASDPPPPRVSRSAASASPPSRPPSSSCRVVVKGDRGREPFDEAQAALPAWRRRWRSGRCRASSSTRR